MISHPSPHVASIAYPGAILLLDEGTQKLRLYNETAGVVWQLLELGLPEPEIALAVAEGYTIAPAVAGEHVANLFRQWKAEGLIDAPASAIADRHVRPTRLATSGELAFTHYDIDGTRLRISTTAPEVAEHIGAILGQFEVEAFVGGTAIAIDLIDSPEPYRLSIDDQDRMHLATAAEAIGAAFRYILGAIHGEADFLALIHGASVVAPSGKALLLPGASGSGKSTLAAYLSRCGFAFLSDDMIALRSPDGRALGWPMPHSIKEGSWHRLAPLMPELATATIYEVRGRKIKYVAATPKTGRHPATPVGTIVFPRYSADAANALVPLDATEKLALLLGDRIWIGYPMTQHHVQEFLSWLAPVPAYRLSYSSLEAARSLLEQLDD